MAAVSTSVRLGLPALFSRRIHVVSRFFCTEGGATDDNAAAPKPLPKDRKNMKPREMVEYLDR